jgi:hypothetical protein
MAGLWLERAIGLRARVHLRASERQSCKVIGNVDAAEGCRWKGQAAVMAVWASVSLRLRAGGRRSHMGCCRTLKESEQRARARVRRGREVDGPARRKGVTGKGGR